MVQPCLVQLINLPLSECNARLFFFIDSYNKLFLQKSMRQWSFCQSCGMLELQSFFRGNDKAGSQGSWLLLQATRVTCPGLTRPQQRPFPCPLPVLVFSINPLVHPSYSPIPAGIGCDWQRNLRPLSTIYLAQRIWGTNCIHIFFLLFLKKIRLNQ